MREVNIVVTTPKSEMKNSRREAEECIAAGGGYYFRRFGVHKPKGLMKGTKIFYVEDGYLRGYGVVERVVNGSQQCNTTGRDWGTGIFAVIPANSWKWIEPIPMKGFQGWRYFDVPYKVVGGWRDARPVITE